MYNPAKTQYIPRQPAADNNWENEMGKATVNIYRDNGTWCYAAWVDGEYDTSDTLGIGDASEDEARTEALILYREHDTQVALVS